MTLHKDSALLQQYIQMPIGVLAGKMRRRINADFHWFSDGRSIFMVHEMYVKKVDKRKHVLIGVYNAQVSTSDLRDDLLWYIDNYLEGKQ